MRELAVYIYFKFFVIPPMVLLCSSNLSTRLDPINPAPPVISTFLFCINNTFKVHGSTRELCDRSGLMPFAPGLFCSSFVGLLRSRCASGQALRPPDKSGLVRLTTFSTPSADKHRVVFFYLSVCYFPISCFFASNT